MSYINNFLRDTEQVNATGYEEKIVRVKVPEDRGDHEERFRPQLVNVQLDPVKTKPTIIDSGSSTVSGSGHYNSYWVSDSDRRVATDRVVAAVDDDTDVVLIGTDRPLADVQKSSVDKRLLLVAVVESEEEEEDDDDNSYYNLTGNRYNVNRRQSMRPPLPVQSSSSRSGNHFPSHVTRAVTMLCILPFSCFVVHLLSWSSSY